MHGLKTPAFLRSSRPASPAPSPAVTPIVAPIPGPSAPITPLDLSVPPSPINEPKEGLPLRRPLAKLHLSSPFRRASPSPAPTPVILDKPGSNYLDSLALRISEAAGKAVASPTPAHNSDGLLLGGRRPLPAGRGRALGQLITSEINAASQGGNDLLRASLRALHRPLNVLLSNVSGLVAPLVVLAPSNVLVPTSGWVGNGAPQAHALGLAILVGELLDALESLPGDCAKVGGEGLRSIKEGLEGVVKRVVNPVLGAVRNELVALVDPLELAPEPCPAGKKDKGDHPALAALQNAMPCAMRVLGRIASIPGGVVPGALAACGIAIVWRAMVALAHRKISDPREGSPTKSSPGSVLKSQSMAKSHVLGKTQSSGSIGGKTSSGSIGGKSPSSGSIGGKSPSSGSISIGSSGVSKRLTPPNTPPAGRFGLLLPPSRPPSPPAGLTPAAQLAHDARVVVGLLDALPKPAADDAREAVVEAFDAFKAFAELLSLLSSSPIDPEAIISLVDGHPQPHPTSSSPRPSTSPQLTPSHPDEQEELPALIVLPALLRGKSPAALLEISESEYRERCLAGFGRAEASEEVVVKAVLASDAFRDEVARLERGWVRGWLEGRAEE